jgi:hypothetical protein
MKRTISIPIRTVTGQNARETRFARARRVKKERGTATMVVQAAAYAIPLPVVVTMTRLSPNRCDDDNLQGAMKAIRDGIADAYRIDDGTRLIEWRYAQRRCKRGDFGVVIDIEAAR